MSQLQNNYLIDSAKLRSLRGWFRRTPFHNVSRNNYSNDANGNEKLYVENTCSAWKMLQLTDKEKAMQRNTFGNWKIYAIHKLERRKKICLADNLYRRRLKRRTFAALITNSVLQRCKTNHKHTLENDIKKQKICLKLFFASWKKYVQGEQMTRSSIAQCFSETRCLKKCLHTWKTFVSKQKYTKIFDDKMLKASKHYTTALLRKSFNCWLHMYSELRKQSNMARKIYKDKILERYYNMWTKFHEIRQNKSRALEEACQYFEKKLLQCCLKRLMLHAILNRDKRSLQQRATEFYRRKQLKQMFLTWKNWYGEEQKIRIKLQTSQRNFNTKMQRRTIVHWQSFVLAKKRNKRKLFYAVNFNKIRLQRIGFKILQNYLSYKKQKQTRILPLTAKGQVFAVELQKVFILKWRKKLYDVMHEKKEMHRVAEFYEIRHIRNYFCYWKKFSLEYKIKLAKKQELQGLASVLMIKRYLVVWVAEYRRVLILKEKESYIVGILKHKTLGRYFTYWKKYIIQRKDKKLRIETAKNVYEKFLLHAGLRHILKISLHQIELRQQNQFNYAIAMSMERVETLRKYFCNWLILTRMKLDLKNLSIRKPLSIIPSTSRFTNLSLPQYMIDQGNYHELINNPVLLSEHFMINKL